MAKSDWYVADFETKGEKFYNENGYTEVWLYSICDSNGEIVGRGTNIEGFIKHIKRNDNRLYYFHNLKFDGNFIIDWLLKNGFEFHEKLTKEDRGFSALIDDMGAYYSITIKFRKNHQVYIYDSYKLIPMSVKDIPKKFGLEEEKEHIDYDDYVVNEKTIHYCDYDVIIVAKALRILHDNGINNLTIASSAYKYYTKSISEDDMKQLFPDLGLEFLQEWRGAYRGGRCQVNPWYANKIMKGVNRYDYNSMYPSIMRNRYLPYGHPIKIEKKGEYRFELYKMIIEFVLKPNHFPSLLKNGSIAAYNDSYYTNSDGRILLYISSIDYEILKRNYDIIYEEDLEMYGFPTTKCLFKKYVDYWYKIKNTSTGGMKQLAKLMLNSLYGKFGSNPTRKHKIPSIDESGAIKLTLSEEEEAKHFYLVMAIAITSYGHLMIDDVIQAVGPERFIYCDTDSAHIIGKLPDDMVSQTELGKMKLESTEEKSKYIRQKTYITTENGKINITCAGMPSELKEATINMYGDKVYDVLKKGFSCPGKLLPKRVKGGVILRATDFTIH